MFSKFKIFFVIASLLVVARLAYAATTSIVDTPFSSNYGDKKTSSPSLPGSGGADDDNTSTYEGIECGPDSAADATACMIDFFGVTDGIVTEFEASCTKCDTGVNCICPASYDKKCDGLGEVGVGSVCNDKFKSCRMVQTPICSEIAYGAPVEYLVPFIDITQATAACKNIQKRSYSGVTICLDGANNKAYCRPAECGAKESQVFTDTPDDNNIDNNFYGVQEGLCITGGVFKYPWYCKTNYKDFKPTACSDAAQPLTCSLEKTVKYACGFPLCGNTDMTVMSINMKNDPTAVCADAAMEEQALSSGLKCYLPKLDSGPANVFVCQCPVEFEYTEETCRTTHGGDFAFKSATRLRGQAGFRSCKWDSQTAFSPTTGKATAVDTSKTKYEACLTTCPTGALLTSSPATCTVSSQPATPCAQVNASGVYEEKYYCLGDCPSSKDVDLRSSPTGLTCDSNSLVTTCSGEYENASGTFSRAQMYFCLNKCADGASVKDEPIGECSNGSVFNVCAKKDSAGDYNEQKYYCSCPKNADGSNKYYDNCMSGYLAGRKCVYEDGITRYELCLPKCDSSEDRLVVGGITTTPPNCGVPQSAASGENAYQDPASGSFRCINTNMIVDCDDPSVIACCATEGSTVDTDTCREDFISIHRDPDTVSNLCMPTNAPQLCASGNGKPSAQWQCSCVGYKDPSECEEYGEDGAGEVCYLDGKDKPKYKECGKICNTDKQIKDNVKQCNEGLGGTDTNNTGATGTPCSDASVAGSIKDNKVECNCPSTWMTINTFCADKGPSCQTDYTGMGTVCTYDLPTVGEGVSPIPYQKYYSFIAKCPTNSKVTIEDSLDKCNTGGDKNSVPCYQGSEQKHLCKCPVGWLSLEEYCTKNPSVVNCLNTYTGVGTACTFDVADINNPSSPIVYKYKDYNSQCSSERPSFDDKSSCKLKDGDVMPEATPCYGSNGSVKYNCNCPVTPGKEYKLPEDCTLIVNGVKQVAAGQACNFDSFANVKYEGCFNKCVNTTSTPVVSSEGDCPLVGGVQANAELCYSKAGDSLPGYACRCPTSLNYQTLDQYCTSFTCPSGDAGCQDLSGGALVSYCKANYIGVEAVCTFDVDATGNSLNKYKSFLNACPTDRPLFYSREECSTGTIKDGVFDRYCSDRGTGQERVLCKCPTTYQTSCTGANVELGGQTCNYEGQGNTKYEGCFTKCDNIPNTNGKGVEYLSEEDNDNISCRDMLGEGATWGADTNGSKCSRNHVLFNPCYCGADYVNKCLNTDNEVPDEGALACTIKGTTYYNQCKNNECAEPSATLAVISVAPDSDVAAACRRQFGDGATSKTCGVNQAECSCNPREYTELCSYPETPPTGNDYCTYADSGLMSAGVKHYKLGACKVDPLMAPCGQHSLSNGTEFTPSGNPTVVTATEGECRSRVGTGGKTQLCEYDNGKRAYNCYYEAGKYKANEGNCPIRHILSGNYVIIGGVKNYEKCDCHPAYKFHKYNCAGMLSGGVCNQSTDGMGDPTIPSNVGDMDFYPYCACPSDYNQVCDGVRNVGVGDVCDGKYKACECKPDPLPENWADNYYGCPGGKKPTGVIKQNGCGGKYYQCSVTECTWQHTEKCSGAFVEGVDACQDAQGNIGGYKSCRCTAGHDKICEEGTVGKGDPCIINGVYRYTDCVGQGTCVRGESKTCQEPLLVGVNSCTKNGITYFEYCKCASGYDKLCENGEVGEGASCKLDGKDYYTKCLKPSMACTADHKDACDTNQEKYEPCVNKDNKLLYKCKCPINWKTCAEGGAVGAETCTDSTRGTVYSECLIQSTCSVEQNKTYKVCTSSQKGVGNSCIAIDGEKTVTKYAACEETEACKVNGYKFSCLGFDATGLGSDSCIDENGNKLYKECKCPSKWMTCPGKTNTKGQSCTPLLENGTSGDVVYESCGCDPSVYRYTCMKSETNLGVKPDNGKSCTPKIPGETEPQEPLYSGCACESAYKNSCKGNGQLSNDNDYCERIPGGEKLYTSCECDPAVFKETCDRDPGNPGMTAPDEASSKCIPVKADGSASAPLYKNCSCGRYYTQICNGTNQLPPENDFCISQEGGADVIKYSKCLCSEDFSQDCIPKDGNQGIYPPPVGDEETCVSFNYVGNEEKRVKHYKECKCKEGYKYFCTEADLALFPTATPDLYTLDSNNYCLASSENERKYTSCHCKNGYKECKPTASDPQLGPIDGATPCVEILANDILGEPKYLAADCQCQPKPPASEYQPVVDYNFDSPAFKLQVKNACRIEENFLIANDGCGTSYFKCAIEDPSYKYTKESCIALSNGGTEKLVAGGASKSAQAYSKNITMYTQCNCPSSLTRTDCNLELTTGLNPQGNEGCHYYKNGASEKWKTTPCNSPLNEGVGGVAVKLDGKSCRRIDGTMVYERCICDRSTFNRNGRDNSGSGSQNCCKDYTVTRGDGYCRER